MGASTAAIDMMPRHQLFPFQQVTASAQTRQQTHETYLYQHPAAGLPDDIIERLKQSLPQEVNQRMIWAANQFLQEKAQMPESFKGVSPESLQFFMRLMVATLAVAQPTSLALSITPDDSIYFTARYGYRTIVADIYFESGQIEPVETVVLIDERGIPKPGFTGSFMGAMKHIQQYLTEAIKELFAQQQVQFAR